MTANDYIRWRKDRILPYAGGYRDQPWWIQSDFVYFDFVEAWLDNEMLTRSEIEAAGGVPASQI